MAKQLVRMESQAERASFEKEIVESVSHSKLEEHGTKQAEGEKKCCNAQHVNDLCAMANKMITMKSSVKRAEVKTKV